MTNTIKQCACGSTHFYLFEDLLHFADIDEEGNLQSHDTESHSVNIRCAECDTEYSTKDFNNVYF